MQLKVSDTRKCDCCDRTHMLHTIRFVSEYCPAFNLGVVCAGHWFDVNTSGNIFRTVDRLQKKIDNMDMDTMGKILTRIDDVVNTSIDWDEEENEEDEVSRVDDEVRY